MSPQPKPDQAATCRMMVNIYDGTRQAIGAAGKELLLRINQEGNDIQSVFVDTASTAFTLPYHDNFQDIYSVIASANGYRQAGFTPVQTVQNAWTPVDLMLIPNDPEFNFAAARWNTLQQTEPEVFTLLAAGADADPARNRYEDRIENKPATLASFFNLTTAMHGIQLPQQTPLEYLKELNWDGTFAQDRFFAWADPALLDQVKLAARQGTFAQVSAALHPGATDSYKQIQFGEANVQLTFHSNNHRTINGLDCILIEPDIDYYKDIGAHLLLEVLVNAVTHTLTDPREVYVLRWIAGRHAGVAEFEPPYTLE